MMLAHVNNDNALGAPYQQEQISLTSLSWEDIVFSHILTKLGWKDLFRLRSTCWNCKLMVDAYFQQIKVVDLSAVSDQFSATAFKVLSLECTNIRKLTVTNARWMLDKDLSVVFKNNQLLSHLDLSGSTSLNGACLLTLAVNCKQLHTLILQDCNWLTHGAVETLITHLDSIEVANLSSCSGISNQQLLPLFQKFYRMKELYLANLQPVNDTTLLVIARSCGSLQVLDVRGCGNITDRGLK
ncbi:F-box/LRR-repeat protein 15, partial [Orchesella cincta]